MGSCCCGDVPLGGKRNVGIIAVVIFIIIFIIIIFCTVSVGEIAWRVVVVVVRSCTTTAGEVVVAGVWGLEGDGEVEGGDGVEGEADGGEKACRRAAWIDSSCSCRGDARAKATCVA